MTRTRQRIHVECPLCGFRLKGNAAHGFRCNRCHAQYSAAFVRYLRRQQFAETINKHFAKGMAPVRVEQETESRMFVEESVVLSAVAEAKESIRDTRARLEEFLALEDAFPAARWDLETVNMQGIEKLHERSDKQQYRPVMPRPMQSTTQSAAPRKKSGRGRKAKSR